MAFKQECAGGKKVAMRRTSSVKRRKFCHSQMSETEFIDERIEFSEQAINWEAIAEIACKQCNAKSAQWGKQSAGGYNLVKFLHLDNGSTIVARVPLLPSEKIPQSYSDYLCARVESEVATMEYVATHTKIPMPTVIHHGVQSGSNVPFLLMTKLEGTQLSSVWDDMVDWKREIVLRQVVDILLELSTLRFEKIGALFKKSDNGKATWYLKPESLINPPEESGASNDLNDRLYSSATDYWIAKLKSELKKISEDSFGSSTKAYAYTQAWFRQSIIPSLYDNSLDYDGFPLMPGDFHSQNILIENKDTDPKIVGVIDWEFSATTPTSSFAQYPFFIVDHPLWEDDHPLKERNIRDQETFVELMRESEQRKYGEAKLANLYENCTGVYLFEQVRSFDFLFPRLFGYIFGDTSADNDGESDSDEDFSTEYNWALMEHGILKRKTQQFNFETEVWNEAFEILGDEVEGVSTKEFLDVVMKHKSEFAEDGKVLNWLQGK
ncbi:hypothetical protein HK098_008135 [Nowakowskiella sp. JEL0407]|nr:hypothetical protein HK098_008135 [Nowakowskiella sp. JEL0407]